MLKDLNIEQTKLVTLMNGISERCFSAAWMENLEFSLWDAVLNGPRRYGHGIITQSDIDCLMNQASVCNSWIVFDESNDETAIGLPAWRNKYNQEIIQNPNKIDYYIS